MTDVTLTSIKGGGSLEVGDYYSTERTTLLDNKVLLPLDGSLLDAITYPQLAAIYSDKRKLTKLGVSQYAADTDIALDVTENFFYNLQSIDAGAVEVVSPDNNNNAVATPLTVPVGQLPYVGCCSDDGQVVVLIARNASGHPIAYYSTDGGGIFNNITITANTSIFTTNPVGIKRNVDVKCNADGSVIRFACVHDNIARVFESTTFGASWVEIWTFSGAVAGLGSSGLRTEISQDLSTALFSTTAGISAGYGVILRQSGEVNFSATVPLTIDTTGTAITVSADGSRLVQVNSSNPLESTANDLYRYSDDDGTTWTYVPVQWTEVLAPYAPNAANVYYSTATTIFQLSNFDKDIAYVVVGGSVAVTEIQPVLAEVHIPTGETKTIGLVPVTNQPPTPSGMRLIDFALKVHDGKEFLMISGNEVTSSYYQVSSGKFLINPNGYSNSNLKIVADAI